MSVEEEFRALFDEHYPAVARYLMSRGHQAADADDLIAGTFEVAWKRMDRVPKGREAVPWLLTVARNLSRNAQRKSKRERTFVDVMARTTPGISEFGDDGRAEAAEVFRALGELGTLDRDLILLVAWDELSPSEAGRVLGLHPATARSRLHRARQRLTTILREQAPAAPGADGATTSMTNTDRERSR